jgi:hypothetical protein
VTSSAFEISTSDPPQEVTARRATTTQGMMRREGIREILDGGGSMLMLVTRTEYRIQNPEYRRRKTE